MLPETVEDHPLILFDGVCNFCNASVNFIIRRDRRARFRFAALQSELGKSVLMEHALPTDWISSLILVEDGQVFFRTDAVLRIARGLRQPWPLVYPCILIPRFIRDRVYDFVARNRYRWFGRRDACMMPTDEIRGRFVDARSG